MAGGRERSFCEAGHQTGQGWSCFKDLLTPDASDSWVAESDNMTSGFLVGVGGGRDRVQPVKPRFKLVGGWWGGGQALCRSVLLPQALAGYRFEGNLTVYGPLKTQSQVSIPAKETSNTSKLKTKECNKATKTKPDTTDPQTSRLCRLLLRFKLSEAAGEDSGNQLFYFTVISPPVFSGWGPCPFLPSWGTHQGPHSGGCHPVILCSRAWSTTR